MTAQAATVTNRLATVTGTLSDQTLTPRQKVARIRAETAPRFPDPPSGAPPPVGDRHGWKQVFLDDFPTNVPLGEFPENPATVNRWSAYPSNWHDTSGNGTYDAHRTVSIDRGLLNIYLHTDPNTGTPLVAALVPMPSGGSGDPTRPNFRYARYAIRFRADPLPRYKIASLLWPASKDLLADGEIDFPEGKLDGPIRGYVHHRHGTSSGDQDRFATRARYRRWHTAVTKWTSNRVRFYLDHKLIGKTTKRAPNAPMHWVIQTETGIGTGAPHPQTAGLFQIDWAAIWRPVTPLTPSRILYRVTTILNDAGPPDRTKVRRIYKVSTALKPAA
jgi:Glycosyl hydrolases family 16